MNLNLQVKRIMAQIRLAVNKYGKIYIKDKVLNFCREAPCQFCNLSNSRTIDLMLIDRVNTEEIRNQVYTGLSFDKEVWLGILNSNNPITIRKFIILMYKFVEVL